MTRLLLSDAMSDGARAGRGALLESVRYGITTSGAASGDAGATETETIRQGADGATGCNPLVSESPPAVNAEVCLMNTPTICAIQTVVAEQFGMTVLDLLSRRGARAVARPRQVAMWVCRHTTLASLPEIGRAFGGRDHTTVMAAIARVDELMAADPVFALRVRQCSEGATA